MLQRKWIRPWVAAVGSKSPEELFRLSTQLTGAVESTIIVCYIILLFVDNPVVRYICLIVSVACAGCAYPVIWPERIRALEGTVASGIGIGLTNACAQFGYVQKDPSSSDHHPVNEITQWHRGSTRLQHCVRPQISNLICGQLVGTRGWYLLDPTQLASCCQERQKAYGARLRS